MSQVEREFGGKSRAKVWTYLIGMFVLVVLALIINAVIKDPNMAREGVKSFLGLPSWAFPLIAGGAGFVIWWLGLKIETDWPEALGAFLVAGSIAGGEILFGWKRMELGGLVVVPYLIPLAVFVVLMAVGMQKSR
jgi:hypothetical protein